MLALTSVKPLQPYCNLVMMNNTANFKGRKYRTHSIVKNELPEQTVKISKTVLNALFIIQPRLNWETEVGPYINDLEASIIYDHALNMSKSENPHTRSLSVCLYVEAAKKGSLKALNTVASLLINKAAELNQDGECPKKRGIKFFKESEKHGNAEAIMSLGLHHLKGNGVKQDVNKALEYYTKAHNLGHQDAFTHVLFIRNELLPYSDHKQKERALTLTLEKNNTLE